MPTQIKNTSGLPLTLGAPYDGILPPGQAAIVLDSPSAAQQAIGGTGAQNASLVNRLLQFTVVPTGPQAGLTVHGYRNIDETLNVALPVVSVLTNTSRFDVLGGPGSASGTLGLGVFVGQRKRLFQTSATGASTVTITPAVMAEGKTFVKLASLGAWADLEFAGPSVGWKVVGLGGPTSSSASYG